MCLAMEYGGEKSLYDLIEERSGDALGPFPAATIFKVALSMARGLKVRSALTGAALDPRTLGNNGMWCVRRQVQSRCCDASYKASLGSFLPGAVQT